LSRDAAPASRQAAGAIPQAGDRFFIGGLELTVAQRDDRRVRLVRIARPKSIPPTLVQKK